MVVFTAGQAGFIERSENGRVRNYCITMWNIGGFELTFERPMFYCFKIRFDQTSTLSEFHFFLTTETLKSTFAVGPTEMFATK